MLKIYIRYALCLLSLVSWCAGRCIASDKVLIPGGGFTPQFGVAKDTDVLLVYPYWLDKTAVTNRDYLKFVRGHPSWKKGKVASLLADQNYLKHWVRSKTGDFIPTSKSLDSPMTNISWYAANDYCVSLGKRLPTVLEWEFAAAASESKPNASKDAEFVQKLLEWYSRPNSAQKIIKAGEGKPNYWGVKDLHGVIWEWTFDFNSVFVSADNRRDAEALKNLFCGAGATSSTDRANYAAYMRYALRGSLQANYTMETLGFRCAASPNINKN